MTRDQVIKSLAQDMTECADLDTVIDFYYESMERWLDALSEEELITEYGDWFEPDAPIVLEKDPADTIKAIAQHFGQEVQDLSKKEE